MNGVQDSKPIGPVRFSACRSPSSSGHIHRSSLAREDAPGPGGRGPRLRLASQAWLLVLAPMCLLDPSPGSLIQCVSPSPGCWERLWEQRRQWAVGARGSGTWHSPPGSPGQRFPSGPHWRPGLYA